MQKTGGATCLNNEKSKFATIFCSEKRQKQPLEPHGEPCHIGDFQEIPDWKIELGTYLLSWRYPKIQYSKKMLAFNGTRTQKLRVKFNKMGIPEITNIEIVKCLCKLENVCLPNRSRIYVRALCCPKTAYYLLVGSRPLPVTTYE